MLRKSALALMGAWALAHAAPTGPVTFERLVLTDQYLCDGVAFGDIDKDGRTDVVAGPYWYQGPSFTARHAFFSVGTFWDAKGVPQSEPTNSMFSFPYDFNGDGWLDVMIMGRPLVGAPFWYENNRNRSGNWTEHPISDHLFGESPQLADVDGDGKPEALTNRDGKMGWLAPDWMDSSKPWRFTAISPAADYFEYTHGLGVGDVDGDGKTDIVLPDRFYRQPAKGSPSPTWEGFATGFRESTRRGDGGAQIFVYDVDADGDNDIITSLDAHGWGLAWYEHTRANGQIKWVMHKLMGDKTEIAKYGVAFSQPHALEVADVDGDGLKDIVCGKRRWAHGPTGDVDAGGAPVVYWWKLARTPGAGATFSPYLIDDNSGVGTQIAVGDVNGDGATDIMTASKLGTFLFLNRTKPVGLNRIGKGKPNRESPRSGVDAAGRTLPIHVPLRLFTR